MKQRNQLIHWYSIQNGLKDIGNLNSLELIVKKDQVIVIKEYDRICLLVNKNKKVTLRFEMEIIGMKVDKQNLGLWIYLGNQGVYFVDLEGVILRNKQEIEIDSKTKYFLFMKSDIQKIQCYQQMVIFCFKEQIEIYEFQKKEGEYLINLKLQFYNQFQKINKILVIDKNNKELFNCLNFNKNSFMEYFLLFTTTFGILAMFSIECKNMKWGLYKQERVYTFKNSIINFHLRYDQLKDNIQLLLIEKMGNLIILEINYNLKCKYQIQKQWNLLSNKEEEIQSHYFIMENTKLIILSNFNCIYLVDLRTFEKSLVYNDYCNTIIQLVVPINKELKTNINLMKFIYQNGKLIERKCNLKDNNRILNNNINNEKDINKIIQQYQQEYEEKEKIEIEEKIINNYLNNIKQSMEFCHMIYNNNNNFQVLIEPLINEVNFQQELNIKIQLICNININIPLGWKLYISCKPKLPFLTTTEDNLTPIETKIYHIDNELINGKKIEVLFNIQAQQILCLEFNIGFYYCLNKKKEKKEFEIELKNDNSLINVINDFLIAKINVDLLNFIMVNKKEIMGYGNYYNQSQLLPNKNEIKGLEKCITNEQFKFKKKIEEKEILKLITLSLLDFEVIKLNLKQFLALLLFNDGDYDFNSITGSEINLDYIQLDFYLPNNNNNNNNNLFYFQFNLRIELIDFNQIKMELSSDNRNNLLIIMILLIKRLKCKPFNCEIKKEEDVFLKKCDEFIKILNERESKQNELEVNKIRMEIVNLLPELRFKMELSEDVEEDKKDNNCNDKDKDKDKDKDNKSDEDDNIKDNDDSIREINRKGKKEKMKKEKKESNHTNSTIIILD